MGTGARRTGQGMPGRRGQLEQSVVPHVELVRRARAARRLGCEVTDAQAAQRQRGELLGAYRVAGRQHRQGLGRRPASASASSGRQRATSRSARSTAARARARRSARSASGTSEPLGGGAAMWQCQKTPRPTTSGTRPTPAPSMRTASPASTAASLNTGGPASPAGSPGVTRAARAAVAPWLRRRPQAMISGVGPESSSPRTSCAASEPTTASRASSSDVWPASQALNQMAQRSEGCRVHTHVSLASRLT